ncbi:MAG: hypothetical protein ACRBFS_07550 [Aureispira sp.]
MKCSTITSLFTTLFLASTFLFLSNAAYAHDVEPTIKPVISAQGVPLEAEGGPRNVIQERTSITVIQLTNDYLEIVVVNKNGEEVHESNITAYKTTISTESWNVGNYTVITTDAYGDRQDFYINIE